MLTCLKWGSNIYQLMYCMNTVFLFCYGATAQIGSRHACSAPLIERSVRRRGLYIHNTNPQHTNIHTLSRIRTRNPKNQASAGLHRRCFVTVLHAETLFF